MAGREAIVKRARVDSINVNLTEKGIPGPPSGNYMFCFNRAIVMSQFGARRHEIHFELASENLFYWSEMLIHHHQQ
jgi:hypothetical protein